MPRVKGGTTQKRKHKKIFAMTKGFRMARNRLFKKANEAATRKGEHQFEGRKNRKRDFRRLWIVRISGALSNYDVKYSRFMDALKKSGIEMDRKSLSEMAIRDPQAFAGLVEKVKSKVGVEAK
jgi:large subunit ribosomal protein L20